MMQKLTTATGDVFGPFDTITALDDRYDCDGINIPYSVVGNDAVIEEWVGEIPNPYQPDLPTLKAAKNEAINAARLAANHGTFPHAGKLIASDPLSRSDIDGINGYVSLFRTLPRDWPGGWKATDNTYVPIADVAAWKAFYTSMVAHGNANFAHAQTLKAQLAAATTAAEVEAIQW